MEGARVRYEIVAEAYRDLEGASARLALIDRLASLVRQTPPDLPPTVALLCQGQLAPKLRQDGAGPGGAAGRPGRRRGGGQPGRGDLGLTRRCSLRSTAKSPSFLGSA
jgi:hypothetical protein